MSQERVRHFTRSDFKTQRRVPNARHLVHFPVMNTLNQRRILVGISGGIAAYKGAEIVRLLKRAGAEVRVVMTRGATEFVTPLTLQALSGHPVRVELFDAAAEAGMDHIELARWADAVLIAPASANTLARLASGQADDLLSTLCLATRAPLWVAPAMNQAMWAHPATRENIARLVARGVRLIGPAAGEQACGETGLGRLEAPEAIVAALAGGFEGGALAGLQVLVTAGPTREAIDPVRYLTNRSSGKMGYAVARAAAEAGAQVTLVSGPVALAAPERVTCVRVETAEEMLAAVLVAAATCDLFIAAAAVADYRPAAVAGQKLKKSTDTLNLELVRNPDILAQVSALPARPFCVGFAAETEALARHAQKKRMAKGLDMIAANRVGPDEGFEVDDNALTLFWEGGQLELPRMNKQRLADQLIQQIADRYRARRGDLNKGQTDTDAQGTA